MLRALQLGSRRLGALLLVALLLLPAALSGHAHGASGASAPCSVCAITHHAPIDTAITFALVRIALVASAAFVFVARRPAAATVRRASGRAPPFRPTSRIS